MQKQKTFLSIIIPAYNEEKRIQSTLEAVLGYLTQQLYTWEIIVVSDGSCDKTVEITKRLQQHYSNIRVIDNKKNKGKGYATTQGMLKSKGTLCLLFDADNATPIEELEKLLPYIDCYGLVIGSIGINGAEIKRQQPLLRVLMGKLGNWFIQAMVLPGIQDSQRGFKLFTQEVVTDIFTKVTIQGWAFDVEVLALARRFGFKIKEVPIRWSHTSESKVGPGAYLQVLIDVLKIRWRLWDDGHKRILRYIISGGTATLVLFVGLFVLHGVLGLWYLTASVIAFILSVFVSFVLQKFWTFENATVHLMGRQFGAYSILATTNLLINTILMYFFVSVVGLWYLVAQFIVSGIIAMWSFFIYYKLIFRRR